MPLTIRTNKDLVIAILTPGKDYDTRKNPSLDPFIRVAAVKIANLIAACATWGIDVPDTDTLKEIEGWLAAWADKNSDQQLASSSVRSSASFKGQTGMGLESNHYGQTAAEMDPTGLLSTVAKGTFCGAAWAGKNRVKRRDWDDRN